MAITINLKKLAKANIVPGMNSAQPIRLASQLRQHLRALRESHGLTQAQLGQMLGVKQARVAEIEANPGAVSVDQLIRVLAVLGATLYLAEANAGLPTKSSPQLAAVQPPPRKTTQDISARRPRSVAAKRKRKTTASAPDGPSVRSMPKKGTW